METPTNTSFEEAMTGPKRPQFLTVICVLSFIWCGLLIIGSIWSVFKNTPEYYLQSAEEMRSFSPEMADQLEQQAIALQESTYLQIKPYIDLLFTLVSLMGVIMMWKLNRKGFFVYLAGELLPYLGFVFAFKETMAMVNAGGKAGAMGGMIGIVLMVLFDIVFIAMYAANLKSMKQ